MSSSNFAIDPEYIASQSRLLRGSLRLTQENLAEMSGLSTRSIEKIESGTHTPQMTSLEMISKAVGVCVSIFKKPSPEEEKELERLIDQATRKTVIAQTKPVRSIGDFLSVYGGWHARRFSFETAANDTALEITAEISDLLEDLGAIWDELYQSQRIEYAKLFVASCAKLEDHGYLCHVGSHFQRKRDPGKADLTFKVGIVSILPKTDADGERHAVIHLEQGWETVPDGGNFNFFEHDFKS